MKITLPNCCFVCDSPEFDIHFEDQKPVSFTCSGCSYGYEFKRRIK